MRRRGQSVAGRRNQGDTVGIVAVDEAGEGAADLCDGLEEVSDRHAAVFHAPVQRLEGSGVHALELGGTGGPV